LVPAHTGAAREKAAKRERTTGCTGVDITHGEVASKRACWLELRAERERISDARRVGE
jgi:hypothetical protein